MVRSLYERTVGCSHPAVKIINRNCKPLIVEYTKHHPPDVTACIFWLKNRQPQKWGDVHRMESSSSDAIRVAQRRVEELRAELKRLGLMDAQGHFVTGAPNGVNDP